MKASDQLNSLLIKERSRLSTTFNGPPYWAIQNVIRRLDFILPLFTSSSSLSEKEVSEYREFYSLGWSKLVRHYFNDGNLDAENGFPLMSKENISWTDANAIYSGMIESCRQLIAYEKAGILDIELDNNKDFTYSFKSHNIGIERFDLESKRYFIDKVALKVIKRRKKKYDLDQEEVKNELRRIISSPDGKRIKYESTPLIDEYYNKMGHFHLLRLQGYDDFGDEDVFGSIPYKKYIDFIELTVGVAFMHLDACLELVKLNPEINLHNILAHTHERKNTVTNYSKYIGVVEKEIDQILSCITLSKENYKFYLDLPGISPAMFIQVSNELIIRSIAGCLTQPFDLLNRELKRRFRSDYDKAVNRREDRFRKELFNYFPNTKIIKIPKGININFNGKKTDIDAIAFDTETGSLGLFQLKWQDPYGKSMVERYSRMTNLFPKANEWIDKISEWIKVTSNKSMINSLRIDKQSKEKNNINNTYIFVISRNTLNFTGRVINETAAWSSWHQLFQSQASIETDFNDPIREMFFKIKAFKAENRESLSSGEINGFDLNIGERRIYYKKRKS